LIAVERLKSGMRTSAKRDQGLADGSHRL
jgi:hypothetical protein